MKTRLHSSILGLIAALVLPAHPALADFEITGSVKIKAKADFDAPLAVHGTWVTVGSHGRSWRPAGVAVGWRPYVRGEWVWTDCGWYWSSDEPWAWACYHYGSWVYDSSLGWVWVPHTKWAPAWVSWRVGGGYVGWAPLPPAGVLFTSHPHSSSFVFVGEAKFGGPVRPGVLIVNNNTIIAKTQIVGGIKQESRTFSTGAQKVMINHGPSVDVVQKASGRRFAFVPIQHAAARTTAHTQSRQMASADHGGTSKTASGGKSEHQQDHAETAGKQEQRSNPGANSGEQGGKARGGHSRGGGRGKH